MYYPERLGIAMLALVSRMWLLGFPIAAEYRRCVVRWHHFIPHAPLHVPTIHGREAAHKVLMAYRGVEEEGKKKEWEKKETEMSAQR